MKEHGRRGPEAAFQVGSSDVSELDLGIVHGYAKFSAILFQLLSFLLYACPLQLQFEFLKKMTGEKFRIH